MPCCYFVTFLIFSVTLLFKDSTANATRTSASEINDYLVKHLPRRHLSEKRGMGYGTGGGQQELSVQDFEIIGGKSRGGTTGVLLPSACSRHLPFLGMDYTPMAWGLNFNEHNMRQYLDNNPNVKYLLGFNEPTHLNQANLTHNKLLIYGLY